MNDAQILAIAITGLAIFGGVLINNARLGDVKEALRAKMRADKADIMNMFAELRRLIETNHDTTLRMLADIDQRVTRLEARS
jgi:hypothetical protein